MQQVTASSMCWLTSTDFWQIIHDHVRTVNQLQQLTSHRSRAITGVFNGIKVSLETFSSVYILVLNGNGDFWVAFLYDAHHIF